MGRRDHQVSQDSEVLWAYLESEERAGWLGPPVLLVHPENQVPPELGEARVLSVQSGYQGQPDQEGTLVLRGMLGLMGYLARMDL